MYLVHTIGSECCGEVELDGGEVKAICITWTLTNWDFVYA